MGGGLEKMDSYTNLPSRNSCTPASLSLCRTSETWRWETVTSQPTAESPSPRRDRWRWRNSRILPPAVTKLTQSRKVETSSRRSHPAHLNMYRYQSFHPCDVGKSPPHHTPPPSPWAHLHVVGMLQFMFLTKINLACPLFFILFLCLFLSLWPFQLNFIHNFSQQLSAFSLCSSSPISALLVLLTIHFCESLP